MKKAQIKMFESLAVLVVFAFLMVFGINFYFTIAKAGVQKELQRMNQLQLLGLAQKTGYLPELECAIGGIQAETCIEVDKLNAFILVLNNTDNQQLYYPVFGWSTVTVSTVFPPSDYHITIYDNAPLDYTAARKVQIPIMLYNVSTRRSDFGIVEVTRYD